MRKPQYLYHGSKYKVDILVPHKAKGLPEENGTECGIYAYVEMNAVLPFALSIFPYSNGGLSIHVNDDTHVTTISAGIIDPSAIGYVYKLPSDSFELLDGRQWLSKIPVKPVEIIEVQSKNFMDKVVLTGSAKEIKQISDSIAPCGLVCKLCHLAEKCSGCKSENNCCGSRKTDKGCFQYNCCIGKGINGCWECEIAPCDKGMFSDSHDFRLRAFVIYIKRNSIDQLAEHLYHNAQKGIHYGHGKDYDNLYSIDAVLERIEGYA